MDLKQDFANRTFSRSLFLTLVQYGRSKVGLRFAALLSCLNSPEAAFRMGWMVHET